MTSIGEQIKEARVANGMTQDALAGAVHVTRATISHWENGWYVPDFNTFERNSTRILVFGIRFLN